MTKNLRNDLRLISSLIEENEKVLDVGCGNGNLIEFLSKEKNVDCKGIEIELDKMNFCLKKGLSVIQGDANYDLNDFSDNSFSTVILSQTIQATIFPERVINNLIRIGEKAIISFPILGFGRLEKIFFFLEGCLKIKFYLMNGLIPQIFIYVQLMTLLIFVIKIELKFSIRFY